MNIKIRLMGMLKEREPPDNQLDVGDSATIEQALQTLHIDPASVHVFTVNGALVRDHHYQLKPGDDLTVLPPVGGG